ncbi:hypothetical protein BaRGS_00009967, partial [Batillaria attramentaria]
RSGRFQRGRAGLKVDRSEERGFEIPISTENIVPRGVKPGSGKLDSIGCSSAQQPSDLADLLD